MYCIYLDKKNDFAVIYDKTEGINIWSLDKICTKIIDEKVTVQNIKTSTFEKAGVKDLSEISISKLRIMLNKKIPLSIDLDDSTALKVDDTFIVINKKGKLLEIIVCELEFIEDCTDIKYYYAVSSSKLQERGLGKNENRCKDPRREEYSNIEDIQVRDCRRKSDISICIYKVKKGDKKEESNIKPETEVRTDTESTDIPLKDVVEKNRLNFGDDDDSYIDNFIPIYSEYDKSCPYCHGDGKIVEDGFIKECKCGERLHKLKELERKKDTNKPLFKINNALKENAVTYGLIPDEYKDIEYDSEVIKKILGQRYKGKGITIQGYDILANTLDTIVASCRTGKKLKHSYIIGGDKGFGKKTFVFTCLKYLYARNTSILCKYISLSELGLLKAEAIKRASSINNLGYYIRDNDRDLVQQAILEESRKAVRGILNEWCSTIGERDLVSMLSKTFGYKNDIKLTLDQQVGVLNQKFEDAIVRNAYTRISEEERIVNYGKEYCSKLINTWEDYINAPLIFVYFSGLGERRFETEVLQILLNIRGAKALPTVAITENGLGVFKDEPNYVEDSLGYISDEAFKAKTMFWDNMISDASNLNAKNLDKVKIKDEVSNSVEYDRMTYVASYIKYKYKLKVGVDI